eukprot:COSAG04_NODE_2394_length_4214_cov_1.506197_5_plen_411_part_00
MYYLRQGAESSKFFVTMEGGGWCTMDGKFGCATTDSCYNRSLAYLGSSSLDTPSTLHWAEPGKSYLSTDPATNPSFWNWTMVYLRYCDGSSFSGRRTQPIQAAGQQGPRPIYHRGNYILRAIVSELLGSGGLASASHVVVSGDSAGGLATYLHAHQWRELLPSTADVVALPDSGFFREWRDTEPEGCTATYAEDMQSIFSAANTSGGLAPACLSAHASAPWECMFAVNAAPHIPVPYFMLQSRYDTWQVGSELGSKDESAVNAFGQALAAHVTGALAQSVAGSGLFLDACSHHTAMGDDIWTDVTVDNVTTREAVGLWLGSVFGGCQAALRRSCSTDRVRARSPFAHEPCAVCAGKLQHDLRESGCSHADVEAYCRSDGGGGGGQRMSWVAEDAYPCVKCCGGGTPAPGF